MNSTQKQLSDGISWICGTCGALNAESRSTCGKCPVKRDPIVDIVCDAYKDRSRIGIEKYGRTLQENDLSILQWLNHLQEELMDATLYIEKLKQEQIKNIEVNEG